MIRINLLASERAQAKKKIVFPVGQKITVLCSLILVVAVVFIGWRFWTLTRQSAQLDKDISLAQIERGRLQSVMQKVKDFEDRKAQLSQRVVLIEDLRKEQKGPVHMLDELSKALPPMLWLTEVKQVAGDVVIDGNSTTQTGVSDFASNLEASGYFKKSVDIVSTKSVALAKGSGDLVAFTLRAQFRTPGEAKAAAAAAATAGATAGALKK
jgi:type IV pilus assembly protein PilN